LPTEIPRAIQVTEADSGTTGTHALIFVIDSSDKARMDEAKSELGRIIQDREMRNVVLLVFANKQDVDGGERCANPNQTSRD